MNPRELMTSRLPPGQVRGAEAGRKKRARGGARERRWPKVRAVKGEVPESLGGSRKGEIERHRAERVGTGPFSSSWGEKGSY